jgi:flavin reductase (DIM6/NTAB) family NADH-FMN oxidoreductase RutF
VTRTSQGVKGCDPGPRIVKEFDPHALTRRERHALTVATVIPRPIGWVSTVDAAGTRNLAPFSYFNAFASTPMILGLGIERREGPDGSVRTLDTLRNIQDVREFTVNLVDASLAEAMVSSSAHHAPDVDEFDVAGVTAVPGTLVKPPRVAESPVAWECVLYDQLEFRRSRAHSDALAVDAQFTTLVLGEVVKVHVADAYVDAVTGRVDWRKLTPVANVGAGGYWRSAELVEIELQD